jgi:hypothetical protein
MCEAQLCPVCCGTGRVWYNDPNVTCVGYYIVCHACGGSGYLIVPCCCRCTRDCQPCYPQEGEWWYSSGNTTVRINIIETDEELPEMI